MDLENITLPSLPFTPVAGAVSANEMMRKLRNQVLRDDVDSVNPIRYAGLTDEQKTELVAYRQALLDLPQQATWPNNIVWPTKPSWM